MKNEEEMDYEDDEPMTEEEMEELEEDWQLVN